MEGNYNASNDRELNRKNGTNIRDRESSTERTEPTAGTERTGLRTGRTHARTQRERERQRQRQRDRDRDRETERQRERERQTDRQTEADRQTETQRERQKSCSEE